MVRTDLIYRDDTLYVNIEGTLNKKEIGHLQKKMYTVISEYGIHDIVIDLKGTSRIDQNAFYDLLDDYDAKYGGNLKILEK